MSRSTGLGLITLFLAGFLLSGCEKSNAQDKQQGGPPAAPKVTVAAPKTQTVGDFREFTGRFEAAETVDIRARVSGYLTESAFTEGSLVTKGDKLFVIDPRPFTAALKKAEADVTVAQSRIAYTEGTYKRAADLFSTGDISAQIRDQRLQERDQAKAELERAKAAREQARLDLSYTTITAPITGRIGKKQVTDGNFVSGGSGGATVLATIVAIDPIHVVFDMDEQTYLAYARKAAQKAQDAPTAFPVMVGLADEEGYPHKGMTDFIDNALDTGTGTMRVRASLPNPKGVLTPGLFARVQVAIGSAASAILVPDSAILIDQSRKFVYVVDAGGMVSARTVEVGQLVGPDRVVTSGLEGNERVIVNGLQRARDGATVTAEEAAPDAETTGTAQ